MEYIFNKSHNVIRFLSRKKTLIAISVIFVLLLSIAPLCYAHASWIVSYIAAPLFSLIISALTAFLDIVSAICSILMRATDIGQIHAITETWKVVRDGVNIVFIAVLLVVGIFNIINYEPDTYALTAYMPNFLIAVIGVNFSKLLCMFILDFTNVITASIYTYLGGGGDLQSMSGGLGMYGENIGRYIKGLVNWGEYMYVGTYLEQFKGLVTGDETVAFGNLKWDFVVQEIVVIVMLFFLIIGFAGLAGKFLVRILQLWVLIASSPLFFMGLSSQYLKHISDGWWSSFWKYAQMPIKVSAYLSIGLLLASKISMGTDKIFLMQADGSGKFTDATAKLNIGTGDLRFYLVVAAVIGTLHAGFKAASDEGGSADKIGDWLSGATRKAMFSMPFIPTAGILKYAGGSLLHKGFQKMSASKKKLIRNIGDKGQAITGLTQVNSLASVKDAHTGFNLFKDAVSKKIESRAEDKGGTYAKSIFKPIAELSATSQSLANLAGVNVGGKLGADSIFGTDKIMLRMEASDRGARNQRANDMKNGFQYMSDVELQSRLRKARDEDEIHALVEVLAERGKMHGASAEAIANGGINGKKFKNQKEMFDYLDEIFDERYFSTKLQQTSSSGRQTAINNFKQTNDEDTNILGQKIKGLIERVEAGDESVEIAELLGAIQMAVKKGKSDPEELTSNLMRLISRGKITASEAGLLMDDCNIFPIIDGVDNLGRMMDTLRNSFGGGQAGIKKYEAAMEQMRVDKIDMTDKNAIENFLKPRITDDSALDEISTYFTNEGHRNAYYATKDHLGNIGKGFSNRTDLYNEKTGQKGLSEFYNTMMNMDEAKSRQRKATNVKHDHDHLPYNVLTADVENVVQQFRRVNGVNDMSVEGMGNLSGVGLQQLSIRNARHKDFMNIMKNIYAKQIYNMHKSRDHKDVADDTIESQKNRTVVDFRNSPWENVNIYTANQIDLAAYDHYVRTGNINESQQIAQAGMEALKKDNKMSLENVMAHIKSKVSDVDTNIMNKNFAQQHKSLASLLEEKIKIYGKDMDTLKRAQSMIELDLKKYNNRDIGQALKKAFAATGVAGTDNLKYFKNLLKNEINMDIP